MQRFDKPFLTKNLILLATILASGITFLIGSTVSIALPSIQAVFKSSLYELQWVLNSFALSLAVLILVGCTLGDKFGRKRVFSIGILLFTLATFASGFSRSIAQLVVFQVFAGVGAALMIPGSLAIINTCFEEQEKGKIIGLWAGLSGGIATLGPFIGGLLIQTLGWRSVFFLNFPLGMFTLFITLKYVPESKNPEARRLDYLGAVLIAISLLGISSALIYGPQQGWTNPYVIGAIVLGIVGFGMFVIQERRIVDPLVPFELFRNPLVLGANLATLSIYAALYAVLFFLTLNLQQVQGLTPALAGLALLPWNILITVFSGPAGSLADRNGPRLQMILGPALVGLGMLWMAFASSQANYFTDILPGLVVFGSGMALVIAPLTKSALAVKTEYSGVASGVNNAVSRTAGFLSLAVFTALMAGLFAAHLSGEVKEMSLSEDMKNAVLAQSAQVGAIEIPESMQAKARTGVEQAIKDSFVYGYRIILIINALLAFSAAGTSIFLVRNDKPAES